LGEWRTVGLKELYRPLFIGRQLFSKKMKKPLDNRHKMWYNVRAVRTGTLLTIKKMGGEPTASAKRTERTYYD
jgi:hypothetical protein